jgi:hypothetical protein
MRLPRKPLFRGNHFLPQHHFQTVVQKETISYHNTISPIHGFPHNMVRLHKCYAPGTVALVHLSTFRLGHWQLYFCRNRLFVTPKSSPSTLSRHHLSCIYLRRTQVRLRIPIRATSPPTSELLHPSRFTTIRVTSPPTGTPARSSRRPRSAPALHLPLTSSQRSG